MFSTRDRRKRSSVKTNRTDGLIEIGVDDPSQLFDRFDQTSFERRHLDDKIDRLILHLARERVSTKYVLCVRIRNSANSPPDTSLLAMAIRHHFAHRARESAANLRVLVFNGTRDLLVGFLFLFICGTLGLLAGKLLPPDAGKLVQEGFVIIGWVALWRPVDLFLYELRPLRREENLLKAMCDMEVRFESA